MTSSVRSPVPTAEHRLVCAAENGDAAAREQLVDAFLPLIASVARIYRSSPAVDRIELMQEGVVGLLRALERYDQSRGTPFWAYASWWVRQAMQDLVSELSRPVVLSDRALRRLARIKDARRELMQSKKEEPTTADLAEKTGFSREQVEKLVATERTPRALEERLKDDLGADSTFGDALVDPRAEDAYERVDRALEIDELRDLANVLSERERAIVCGHFGLEGREQTLRELGTALHLSAERVRQIEEHALEKLRVTACA